MRCTYPQICIYYHEIYEQNKTPNYRKVCDAKDGEEIRFVTECDLFTSFRDTVWKTNIDKSII